MSGQNPSVYFKQVLLSVHLWFIFISVCSKNTLLSILISSQCWAEAAAVSGPSTAEEVPHLNPRWGHSSCWPGDRRPDSGHHPQRVFTLHCPHHRPPPAQHHGQLQVSWMLECNVLVRCRGTHFTLVFVLAFKSRSTLLSMTHYICSVFTWGNTSQSEFVCCESTQHERYYDANKLKMPCYPHDIYDDIKMTKFYETQSCNKQHIQHICECYFTKQHELKVHLLTFSRAVSLFIWAFWAFWVFYCRTFCPHESWPQQFILDFENSSWQNNLNSRSTRFWPHHMVFISK